MIIELIEAVHRPVRSVRHETVTHPHLVITIDCGIQRKTKKAAQIEPKGCSRPGISNIGSRVFQDHRYQVRHSFCWRLAAERELSSGRNAAEIRPSVL